MEFWDGFETVRRSLPVEYNEILESLAQAPTFDYANAITRVDTMVSRYMNDRTDLLRSLSDAQLKQLIEKKSQALTFVREKFGRNFCGKAIGNKLTDADTQSITVNDPEAAVELVKVMMQYKIDQLEMMSNLPVVNPRAIATPTDFAKLQKIFIPLNKATVSGNDSQICDVTIDLLSNLNAVNGASAQRARTSVVVLLSQITPKQ